MRRRPPRSQTPVTGSCVGLEAEQLAPQRGAFVVVAGDPDQRRAEALGDGLDGRAQLAVGLGLARGR